jgi:hypothetical protein
MTLCHSGGQDQKQLTRVELHRPRLITRRRCHRWMKIILQTRNPSHPVAFGDWGDWGTWGALGGASQFRFNQRTDRLFATPRGRATPAAWRWKRIDSSSTTTGPDDAHGARVDLLGRGGTPGRETRPTWVQKSIPRRSAVDAPAWRASAGLADPRGDALRALPALAGC